MKKFLEKTEIIGITTLSIPILVLLVIFFHHETFNRFALFLIVVSIMQIVLESIEKEKKTSNPMLLKQRKFFGYTTLIISIVYCAIVIPLREYCEEVSVIAFVVYTINAFMLYRSVRNLDL